MNNPILEISKTITITWVREISITFQTHPKNIIYSVAFLQIISIFFGFTLAFVATGDVDLNLPLDLKNNIFNTSVGASFIITGVVAALLSTTTSASTAFHTLLDLLPVSKISAHIGMKLPLIAIGLSFSIPLSATSILLIMNLTDEWWKAFVSLFALLISILATLLASIGLFTLTHFILRYYIKIPYNYSTTISGSFIVATVMAIAIGDIISFSPPANDESIIKRLFLHIIVADVLKDPSSFLGWSGIIIWLLAAILLFSYSGRFHEQDLAQKPLILLKNLKPQLNPLGASCWLAFLTAIRTSQFIMTVLLPVPLLAIMWLVRNHPFLVEILPNIALTVPSIPAYLAIYAVGRMLRLRWSGTVILANSRWWILPTISAYLSITIFISTILIILEIILGFTSLSNFHDLYSRVLLSMACALLGGTLVPYSDEQTLSITAAGLTTLVLLMSVSLLISFMPLTEYGILISLLRASVALLILIVAVAVCVRIEDNVQRSS